MFEKTAGVVEKLLVAEDKWRTDGRKQDQVGWSDILAMANSAMVMMPVLRFWSCCYTGLSRRTENCP